MWKLGRSWSRRLAFDERYKKLWPKRNFRFRGNLDALDKFEWGGAAEPSSPKFLVGARVNEEGQRWFPFHPLNAAISKLVHSCISILVIVFFLERKERKGKKRKEKERKGKKRKEKERKGKEKKEKERKEKERKGKERKGKERKGKERKGKERKGKERKEKERKGKERKGKKRKGKKRKGRGRKGKERKGRPRKSFKDIPKGWKLGVNLDSVVSSGKLGGEGTAKSVVVGERK